jgi:hypothetical protein
VALLRRTASLVRGALLVAFDQIWLNSVADRCFAAALTGLAMLSTWMQTNCIEVIEGR